MSRGHSLTALLEEYPISTVHALAKAATVNRVHDMLSMSSAVAAGAVHAIECGFSGKTPRVLKSYQDGLMKQIRKTKGPSGVDRDAQALLGGFAGLAKQEKHGRRKDQSRSRP